MLTQNLFKSDFDSNTAVTNPPASAAFATVPEPLEEQLPHRQRDRDVL